MINSQIFAVRTIPDTARLQDVATESKKLFVHRKVLLCGAFILRMVAVYERNKC
jgi:hypothetical protein